MELVVERIQNLTTQIATYDPTPRVFDRLEAATSPTTKPGGSLSIAGWTDCGSVLDDAFSHLEVRVDHLQSKK